ncbi:MAG: hypothetical protein Q4D38_03600 [Planctomycetia bacterium]|nr:hypothetical protein [Planctomycetia bacterium]
MLCLSFVLVAALALVNFAQVVCAQELILEEACFSVEECNSFRQRWIEAGDQGRIRLVEEIGETGAERTARSKGWEKLLGKEHKAPNHSQGFDQVWRSSDRTVHVIEAKGGNSPVETHYRSPELPAGFKQGTPEWCVESAKKTLKSNVASEAEKQMAKIVLEAAEKGKLNVHVIRTKHVLGSPSMPVWESMKRSTEKSMEMASKALRSLRTATPATHAAHTIPNVGTSASVTNSTQTATQTATQAATQTAGKTASKTAASVAKVAKVAGAAGVAIDVGLRAHEAVEVEKQYKAGQITKSERGKAHTKNAAGMAGGWGGAAAGGYGGAAVGAAIGSVVPGPGTAIGGFVGGVVGAVGGYFGGEKAAEATVDACWD